VDTNGPISPIIALTIENLRRAKSIHSSSMLASTLSSRSFSLADELVTLSSLRGDQDISSLRMTPKEMERKLNSFEDMLVQHPSRITEGRCFHELKDLILCFNGLVEKLKGKLILLIITAFTASVKDTNLQSVEQLAYLSTLIAQTAERFISGEGVKRGGFDWSHLKGTLVEACKCVLNLSLDRMCSSNASLEALVSICVRCVHQVLEADPKSVHKPVIIEVMTIAAKKHGWCLPLQTIILQDLNYNESLAEPLADLMASLRTEGMFVSVLAELGSTDFSEAASRIASTFVIRLATLAPKELYRHLDGIEQFIDNPHYPLRMAMLEVWSMLIAHLLLADDRDDQKTLQAKSLFALIEERFRDVSSFVRAKALHVCGELCRYAH
jgi:hypothetical protein